MNTLYLKMNCLLFFPKELLDVIAMQRLHFKNSIIAFKLYHVMILNLYLTSEGPQDKSDFVVAVF